MPFSLEAIGVLIGIIGAVAAVVSVYIGLFVFKKPRLKFTLKKVQFSLYNSQKEERKVSMLTAVVSNRKAMFGDTAKKATSCLLFRVNIPDEKSIGLNASSGLPWMGNCEERNIVNNKLTTKEDVLSALEGNLFERKEIDIPQGRASHLAVAFGIEDIDKMFLATSGHIELPFPRKDEPNFTGAFLNLEIAGENFPSKYDNGTLLMLRNWNEWTFPKTVKNLSTPSPWKNLLLQFGIGKKQKIIESE